MKVKEIFEKPIDRPIEGVIKADDEASLRLEVEEYVITNEVLKSLEQFLAAYNEYQGANGVWISGFFGSGKSHLLKVLAMLLENRQIDGATALDKFLPKVTEAMLKGDLKRAVGIPSRSILFNIDQKADTISKTETDAVLAVFVKVFNETCGYYGKQGYVAQFERDLDHRNLLGSFKQAYKKLIGKDWEKGREEIILEKENVARAYAQVTATGEDVNKNIIDAYRQDYKLSIEDFAKQVNDYIEQQLAGFRLNFFVDEVGHYIADNVKLMTNLQTIAESLATKCKGRSWLVVTAQEDMSAVLGGMGKQLTNDFSQIQDRFKTRLKLTSQNVDEVIQRRLLAKNAQGAARVEAYYDKEKNNFGTLFDFTDGATLYRGFKDRQNFVDCYPFVPYQFGLFQAAIENLSAHNAFEGVHSSVGERSMLGVFQEVAIDIASAELGQLATFDRMFEGIRKALKASTQRSILNAENQLQDKFAIRVLKALLLVKYIKGFNATPRNLRVLLQETFDQDIAKLRKNIEEALGLLERQTYVQRNGEVYEYLTDEEKDIEVEIKGTDVDSGETAQALGELLFSEIIRDPKIRYDTTGQDYPFTKKLDDRITGREHELAIHFISPFNENVENLAILQANSLGRPELLIALPSDAQLVADLLQYKRTQKYVRVNQSATRSDSVLAILKIKGEQNMIREHVIQARVRELIGSARFFVAGDDIEVSGHDAKSRIIKGFNELVVRTYPNLRMLEGASYAEEDIRKYLELTKGSMFGGDATSLTEPEQEMLSFIQSNRTAGTRTTMKGVEEYFSKKPYGWYLSAIQCMVAMLSGRGKVELSLDATVLDGPDLERSLRNTQIFSSIVVAPQAEVSPAEMRRLKDFFGKFFDRPTNANEAKALGGEARAAFQEALVNLREFHALAGQYPFLAALDEPMHTLQELAGKEYSYYFQKLPAREQDLLEIKDDVIDPVRQFMGGASRGIYDGATQFLQRNAPNLTAYPSEKPAQLRALLASPDCFKGSKMREAKSLWDSLKKEVDGQVETEKKDALRRMQQLEKRLQSMPEYSELSEDQREQVAQSFKGTITYIQSQELIAVIRDQTSRYEAGEYNQLLTRITDWTKKGEEAAAEYISTTDLDLKMDLPYLATEADIESYLGALKKAMLAAIRANKRIRF